MSELRIQNVPAASATPETAESQNATTVATADKEVFYADGQDHRVSEVTSIQSRSLDMRKRIKVYFEPKFHVNLESSLDISIRPQALKMGAPLLELHTQRRIQQDFTDHHLTMLGDRLDTSNMSEYLIDLVTYCAGTFGDDAFQEVFGIAAATAKDWTDQDWQKFIIEFDQTPLETQFEKVESAVMRANLNERDNPDFFRFPLSAVGNHDGAAWGNGLNHGLPWIVYLIYIRASKIEKADLERRIGNLERKIQREDTPSRKSRHGKPDKLAALIERKNKLERRRAVLEKKIPILEDAKKKAEISLGDKSFEDRSITLTRFLTNQVFGITSTRRLDGPEGYWADNAGGAKYTVNKEDNLFHYLRMRYPELPLKRVVSDKHDAHPHHDHLELFPLATQIYFPNADKNKKTRDYYAINSVKDPDTGEYVETRSETLILDDDRPETVALHFDNFWKEVRPGEWICLVDYPNGDRSEPSQHYIFLQAVDQGVNAAGDRVFSLMLDGMDYTQEDADIAFFAAMSELQRQLLEVFENEMRRRTLPDGMNVEFRYKAHAAIEDHSMRYWKRYGWPEHFATRDIEPFFPVGHGHMRKTVDEAHPRLFGRAFAIGRKYVDSKTPYYSLMTPSTTDAPAEFMSIERKTDPATGTKVLERSFHAILSEDDIADSPNDKDAYIGFDIVYAVESLRDTFRQHEYRDNSNQPTDLLPSLKAMLFSQDRITALDSIPIACRQFEETLTYGDAYLRFLAEDFGDQTAQLPELAAAESQIKSELHAQLSRLGFTANTADLESATQQAMQSTALAKEDLELLRRLLFDWNEIRENIGPILHYQASKATLVQLKDEFDRWLNGDTQARTRYVGYDESFIKAKEMGYRAAKDLTDGMLLDKDKISLLLNFRDVFASPAYLKFLNLIALTPADSQAYKFWLLLAKRAGEEEARPINRLQAVHSRLTQIDDRETFLLPSW